jgi:hypothetical protein
LPAGKAIAEAPLNNRPSACDARCFEHVLIVILQKAIDLIFKPDHRSVELTLPSSIAAAAAHLILIYAIWFGVLILPPWKCAIVYLCCSLDHQFGGIANGDQVESLLDGSFRNVDVSGVSS